MTGPGRTGAGGASTVAQPRPAGSGFTRQAATWPAPVRPSLRRALARLAGRDLATAAHVASLAGAIAFWAWLDRGLWFFGDEWDFLVSRGLGYPPGSVHGIWFPHNEHWSTLPILAWRALYSLWHLSSYWPYLGLLLAVQALTVHLAWRACRRAGASPWVSTAAALMLGFLGAGAEDFGWAFQVGFVGSVAFGLLAFDLLDRPGSPAVRPGSPGSRPQPAPAERLGVPAPAEGQPSPRGSGVRTLLPANRSGEAVPVEGQRLPRHFALPAVLPEARDVAVSAALLASLMCSTIGDAMVVGAAVLAFARLPKARALRLLWPPTACYVVWFFGVGRLGIAAHSDHFDLSTFTSLPGYVWEGLSTALGRAFNFDAAGAALLVGLAAWVAWRARRLWAERPALIALCASALTFYALAAVGRDAGGGPTASRYVYVVFAILLPVVAVVLDGGGRWGWAPARVAAVGLLVLSTLGNVGQARAFTSARTALTTRLKTQLEAVGELVAGGTADVSGPGAAPVPGDPNLQVADIAQLERARFLPKPHLGAATVADARAVLALGVWDGVQMTLSHAPLSSARFELVQASGVRVGHSGGCVAFSPLSATQVPRVQLEVPAGEKSAAVLVESGPSTTARFVGAMLVAPRTSAHAGQARIVSAPVELAVPARGTGWLNDNAAGSGVILTWTYATPVTLCGLRAGK